MDKGIQDYFRYRNLSYAVSTYEEILRDREAEEKKKQEKKGT